MKYVLVMLALSNVDGSMSWYPPMFFQSEMACRNAGGIIERRSNDKVTIVAQCVSEVSAVGSMP